MGAGQTLLGETGRAPLTTIFKQMQPSHSQALLFVQRLANVNEIVRVPQQGSHFTSLTKDLPRLIGVRGWGEAATVGDKLAVAWTCASDKWVQKGNSTIGWHSGGSPFSLLNNEVPFPSGKQPSSARATA